jgi:serine/threonine protein kinase
VTSDHDDDQAATIKLRNPRASGGPSVDPASTTPPDDAATIDENTIAPDPTPTTQVSKEGEAAIPEGFTLPDRFASLGVLGEGGMGRVLRVHDRSLNRQVALKTLTAEVLGNPSNRARFLREARAAGALRHPHLVTVYDVSPDGDYLVMELVEGESLGDRLKRERKLGPDEVRAVGAALLSALGAAHRSGIVHRDVKPSNILLGEDGSIKLADFGVASFGTGELTTTGELIGTPAFMAPEQLRGRRVDSRADIYSAGVTLFEAATGRRLNGREGTIEDPRGVVMRATGDATLANAITQAVQEREGDRFQDVEAFAEALEELPPRQPTSRAAIVAAVASAILVSFAGVALYEQEAPRPVVVAQNPRAVAALPFVDETGNERLDFAQAGLPHMLGRELARAEGIEVIGFYRVLERVADESELDDWRRAAGELQAGSVVHGRLERAGDRVRLVVVLERGSDTLKRIEREVDVEDVPEAVRGLAPVIASTLTGGEVEAAPTRKRSLEAERALQLGVAALEGHDLEKAHRHLTAAITIDPELAEAKYHLAVLQWWRSSSTADELATIQSALVHPLAKSERAFLLGLEQLVDLRYPDAVTYFRDLAGRYPRNRDIRYGLVEALYHGGYPDEAAVAFSALKSLSPGFSLGSAHVLEHHITRGEVAKAKRVLDGWDLDAEKKVLWRARLAMGEQRPARAVELLERAIEVEATRRPGLERALIEAYVVTGDLALAEAALSQLADRDPGYVALARLGIARLRGDDLESPRIRAHHAAALGLPGMKSWAARLDVAAMLLDDADDHADAIIELQPAELQGRIISRDVGVAFISDALGLGGQDARKSHFPEVAAVGEALAARRRGRHKEAAAAWRRALSSTVEGHLRNLEHLELARALDAAGDAEGAKQACGEIVKPRWFTWGWAAAVTPCRAFLDTGRWMATATP